MIFLFYLISRRLSNLFYWFFLKESKPSVIFKPQPHPITMLDSKRPGFPLKAIFATLILISWQWAAGQLSNPVFTSRGSLGSEPGIQLLIQNVQNPCGNSVGLGSKKTLFRLRLSGIKSKYSTAGSKYILTLRLRMEDCKGKSIGKNFTIDLARYPKEGEIKNDKDWYVEGSPSLL